MLIQLYDCGLMSTFTTTAVIQLCRHSQPYFSKFWSTAEHRFKFFLLIFSLLFFTVFTHVAAHGTQESLPLLLMKLLLLWLMCVHNSILRAVRKNEPCEQGKDEESNRYIEPASHSMQTTQSIVVSPALLHSFCMVTCVITMMMKLNRLTHMPVSTMMMQLNGLTHASQSYDIQQRAQAHSLPSP